MTSSPPSNGSPAVENLLVLPRILRTAGLPLGLGQTLDFLRALAWIDLEQRSQVYHTARSLLVSRHEHLRLFDALFASFWRLHRRGTESRAQKAPRAPRHDAPKTQRFDVTTYMAFKARQSDPEIDTSDRSGTFSASEILQRKDFGQMTPEELDSVARLLRQLKWSPSERRTRRRVPDRHGRSIDRRRALREIVRHGGVVPHLPRRRRKIKRRPLVVLADISGSMEKVSRLLLQFFYSAAQSWQDVEVFLFATRLTRITAHLKIKNIDRAVDEAARDVIDWAGGTRIGSCLGDFNRRFGRRVLRRGAVVLILSDGWERGDVTRLGREMRHLRDRCHRLIWLNPLSGKAEYRPLVEGMATALPHVDDFLPLDTLQSLDQLIDHLASLPAKRPLRRGASPRPHGTAASD